MIEKGFSLLKEKKTSVWKTKKRNLRYPYTQQQLHAFCVANSFGR